MPAPKSLAAYSDCQEHFEAALENESGIAITLPSKEIATRYSQKLNTFRTLMRKQNALVYDEGHPQHGTTPWDHFKVSKDPENPARLLLVPYRVEVLSVEKL